MNTRFGMLAMCVMVAAFGSTVQGDVLDIPLNDTNAGDNFLYNNQPTTNFAGSGIFYYDQRGANNDSARPIIQFDLPTLPAGATLVSAQLQIKVQQYTFIDINNGNASVPYDFSVHQMLVPWDEGTSNWNTSDGVTPWNTAGLGVGADYNATAEDTVTVSSADVGNYISYDITSLVNDWYNAVKPNYGLSIQGPAGVADYSTNDGDTTDGVFRGYNSEYANDAYRPHLVIEYVPEPASLSLLLCGGMVLMGRRK